MSRESVQIEDKTSIANSLNRTHVMCTSIELHQNMFVYCYERQNSLKVQYHSEIVNVNRSLHTHLILNITTHYLIVAQKQRLVCHVNRLFQRTFVIQHSQQFVSAYGIGWIVDGNVVLLFVDTVKIIRFTTKLCHIVSGNSNLYWFDGLKLNKC